MSAARPVTTAAHANATAIMAALSMCDTACGVEVVVVVDAGAPGTGDDDEERGRRSAAAPTVAYWP